MRQQFSWTLMMLALVGSACSAQKESLRARSSSESVLGGERDTAIASAEASLVRGVRPRGSGPAFQSVLGQSAPERGSARIPSERKLLRTGEMTVEVPSVTDALAKLGQIVISVGGQTANRSERQNEYGGRAASVTCRVPAERLDQAIDALKALGRPRVLTLTAEDVTTSYFDVSVRINTQTQLERQLVAILQRPTNKLADLLEVERELARVREEIDRLEGRKRSWDNQIALSSLVVTLEEPAPVVAGTGGGLLRTLAQSFGQAAENFVLAVATIISATGAILPVALLVGAVGWVAVRLQRRRRAPAPAV